MICSNDNWKVHALLQLWIKKSNVQRNNLLSRITVTTNPNMKEREIWIRFWMTWPDNFLVSKVTTTYLLSPRHQNTCAWLIGAQIPNLAPWFSLQSSLYLRSAFYVQPIIHFIFAVPIKLLKFIIILAKITKFTFRQYILKFSRYKKKEDYYYLLCLI